jgi:sec-independent protein translocase protein TatC
VVPKVTIENYFDRFVDAMLGIGLVFEIPVLVFFLTLIGVASPAFLLKH